MLKIDLTKICVMAIDSGLGESDVDSLLVGGRAVLTLREATLISNIVKAVDVVIDNVGEHNTSYVSAKYLNSTLCSGITIGDAVRHNTVLPSVGSVKIIPENDAAKTVNAYVRDRDYDSLFNYITRNYLFKEQNDMTALLLCIQMLLEDGVELKNDGNMLREAMRMVRSGEEISITSVLKGEVNEDYVEFNGQKYLVQDVVKNLPVSVRNKFDSDYLCAKSNVAMYATFNIGGVL